MADRTSLKIADSNAISDDDPFAELTRIMGFDPRQPVKPRPADPVMSDDFDIDLEKELMGEFGLDSDQGIAASDDAPAVEAVSYSIDDGGAEVDLDEAVAASMQDFEIDGSDFDADGEAILEATPTVEFERDFNDDLTQAIEADPQLQWPAEPEVVADETAEAPADMAVPHDFEAHFDAAMADVDMDFDAPAVSIDHQDAPLVSEAVAVGNDDGAVEEYQAPEALEASAADPFDDAFSLELDGAPAEEVAVEPAAAAAGGEERSLEDELNALLGNMGARISKPATAASPFSWASSAQASLAPANDPFAVAAAGYGAQQHEPQSVSYASATEAEAHPDIDAMLLEELASTDIADDATVEASAEDTVPDFDAADFEAFARDDEAEQASAIPVSEGPILARSWNRMVSTPEPSPIASEDTVPAAMAASEPVWHQEPQAAETEAYYGAATETDSDSDEVTVYPYEPEATAEADEVPANSAYDDIPDVETVDVPERVEALADDLDLPELAFEEDRPVKTAFDDLDAEFAGLLSQMNDTEEAPAPASAPSYDDEPYEAGFRHAPGQPADSAPAYVAHHPAQTAAVASYGSDVDIAGALDTRPFAPVETFASDELEYDPEMDETMAGPGASITDNEAQPRRRGLLIAAVVAGVAIVGGIGAFALSPGGSGSDGAPVLVKADDAPIKVKPENPGGTVVPNQDNKVYEAVAKGVQPAAPEQQKLVANTQEPVNVNTAAPQNRVIDLSPDDADDVATTGTASLGADDAMPGVKSEDRIDQATQQSDAADLNQDVALVTPRKVRTMIVKPDGTLAPREDVEPAAPQVAVAEPADPAPQRVVSAPAQAGEQTGAVQPTAEQPATAEANAQSVTTPTTVAAVPQRPSDQPVDIVGEVKPDQVAAVSAPAAAAGSWAMQIASQPSAESAQSTYRDLAKRYAGVLDGHTANIVKAEIAGKGTFYRVRVPANSRNDAIKLCESYKAAGGNCFVSK